MRLLTIHNLHYYLSLVRSARQAILENASSAITFTRNGIIMTCNPQLERMYGWPPGSLAGKPGAVGVLGGIRLAAGADAWRARLSWSAALPPGTGVAFRTRSAGSESDLAAAPWSTGLRGSGAAVESPPRRG